MPALPALISTLWAVGCQLRMPTRFECPSSLTTGSVSGEVSPPSGISQICWSETNLALRHDTSCSGGRAEENGRSYHDAAVLGTAGDDVVVVRTELDVQNRTCVSTHGGVGHVYTSGLQTTNKRYFLSYRGFRRSELVKIKKYLTHDDAQRKLQT